MLVDYNNRQATFRLHVNPEQKDLGALAEKKNDERIRIDALADVSDHTEKLQWTVGDYDNADD